MSAAEEPAMDKNKKHEALALMCAEYLAAIPNELQEKSETVVVAFDLADPVAHDVARDLAHDRAGSGDAEFSKALADANKIDEKVLIFTDTTRAEMRAVLVKNGITRAANRLASTAMCEGWFVTMTEGRTRIGMIPIGAVQ